MTTSDSGGEAPPYPESARLSETGSAAAPGEVPETAGMGEPAAYAESAVGQTVGTAETAGLGEPAAGGAAAVAGAASGVDETAVPAVTAIEAGAEGIGGGRVASTAAPSTRDEESTVDQLRDTGRTALAILADFARQRPAAFLASAMFAGVLARHVLVGARGED